MSAPLRAALEVRGLRKSFGPTTALDGLDLDVRAGEVHGFLGQDPWRDAVALHRRIAYVPGDVALWPNLTGGEVLDLLGRLRGTPDRARTADLVARFDLDPSRRVRTYSTGNRQKVALVAAFAADVDLLVLDEPTSGLDPLMEAVFTACVLERRAAGVSVLLSSHILGEVEKVCDTVTIVRHGRTVESGSLASLRHLTRPPSPRRRRPTRRVSPTTTVSTTSWSAPVRSSAWPSAVTADGFSSGPGQRPSFSSTPSSLSVPSIRRRRTVRCAPR
jgi:ABC-2 type transport system ATP-binding protein